MNNEYIKINNKKIGYNYNSYFIADIAANHDNNINKAEELIHKAKEAGADAAKFQHFNASSIVSDYGFKKLKNKLSHQSKWKKSVYEVYKDASINQEWTKKLYKICKNAKIDFFTSPYSLELVDHVDRYVCAYKIGSGDITWHGIIKKIAKKNKPLIIATGASNINEVEEIYKIIKKYKKKFVLMQCNTNYTASLENFKYINLNVLKTYSKKFKNCILGLSDHTPGHSTVLGSIALGARVIEKHFTLNNNDEGPDHKFSMTPNDWSEMIKRSRELENALGSGVKKIEQNEKQTSIVQRRSIRTKMNLIKGTVITEKNVTFLRPCPKNSLHPYQLKNLLGKKIKKNIQEGDIIKLKDVYN